MSQLLCKRLGHFEPCANDVYIPFGRIDAAPALFAKAMQHKHRLGKLDGVHRPVRAILIVIHQFQYARAAKALEHLGRIVLIAALREVQRMPKELAYLQWQGH